MSDQAQHGPTMWCRGATPGRRCSATTATTRGWSRALETVVGRLGWDLLCFVLMPNHFHLLVRTPRPNLSRGMQHLTSGYANWCSRRHRRPGHTFQGRFKSELIEDESYFWTVSRYIHLNPVRGKRPLADHPRDWPWSSYPGYDRRRRVGWVAYEALHSAWRGESGGNDPEAAYRRFVEQGLARAPANPFQSAAHGWLLGSETFIERMRSLLSEPRNQDEVPAARQLASLDAAIVLAEVARYYGVDQDCFQVRRSGLLGRDLAAWLVRHHSSATLRELAPIFGLNHPDSVNHLVRRVDRALARSSQLREDIGMIQRILEQRRHGSS